MKKGVKKAFLCVKNITKTLFETQGNVERKKPIKWALRPVKKVAKNNKNCKKYLARYTCLLYNSKGQRRQGKTDGVSHLLFLFQSV